MFTVPRVSVLRYVIRTCSAFKSFDSIFAYRYLSKGQIVSLFIWCSVHNRLSQAIITYVHIARIQY